MQRLRGRQVLSSHPPTLFIFCASVGGGGTERELEWSCELQKWWGHDVVSAWYGEGGPLDTLLQIHTAPPVDTLCVLGETSRHA